MLRYVGLHWNRTNRLAEMAANAIARRLLTEESGWSKGTTAQGCYILYRRDDVSAVSNLSLGEGHGVIFGTLFRSADHSDGESRRIIELDDHERARIIASDGRALIDDYWGRYVAFVFDPKSHRLQVIRDPSEGLPCYYAHQGGVTAIFSDLRDAILSNVVPRSVNWPYIHAHLRWNRLHTRETSIDGIYALHGGECLTCSEEDHTRTFYWAPHTFCHSKEFEDEASAAVGLRSAVHDCAKTWASVYDVIVELLSGGLDSAILLSGLRRGSGPSGVICLNLITPGLKGDERAYASKAAAFWDCELVECDLNAADVCLADSVDIPAIPIPSYHILSYRMNEVMGQVARERGAQAIMTARAGDQLFYKSNTPLTVADYVSNHWGFGHPIRVAKDRAMVIGSTVPEIMIDVWKYGIRRRRYDPYPDYFQYAPFIDNDAIGSIKVDDFRHPWLKDDRGLSPGKVDHIYAVIDGLIFNYDPLGSSQFMDVINPLVSQPIIERCLEIPSYVLAYGRQDRALARHAFSEDVPTEILNRCTKGGTARYRSEVIEHNRDFLCEFLLDGKLATHHVIVPEVIEPILTGYEPLPTDYWFSFMSCISVEAWLRSFDNVGTRAAA